jgi:Zinc finger, C2H2 type
MQTHQMRETRERFPCSSCDKNFFSKSGRNVHFRKSHLGITNDEFKCGCGLVFKNYINLYNHKETVHLNKSYTCTECDMVFQSKSTLTRHNASRHDPKQPCEICGVMVPRGTDYKNHVKLHNPSVKCKFPGCDKVFTKQKNARYHYETKHLPPKHVSCQICNSSFTADILLKFHITRNHETQRVKCLIPECNFTALRRHFLDLHYKKHTEVDGTWRAKFQQHVKEVKFRKIKLSNPEIPDPNPPDESPVIAN